MISFIMSIKVIFTLTIFASTQTFTSAAPRFKKTFNETLCNQMLLDTDKCVARVMFIGEREVAVPRNETELRSHCGRVERDIPCFKKYGDKCLNALPRTLFALTYKAVTQQFKRLCNTPDGRAEYLKHVVCMQPKQISVVHQYLDMITTYLDYINENVKTDEILPHICCAYFKVFEDATRDLHMYCDNVTGPETVDWTMNLVRSISYDMIDLSCGRYASTESCLSNLPEAMKTFVDMATPFSKITPRGYTPIVPAIKLIKRLDDSK